MPPRPRSAQPPPNALMLQPLAVRPSLPSVLALLWDAYQRMALIPPNPLKLYKHARSFGLTLQTPFSIILMIPKLSQRLHLPWDGPSESMEQKRIGGSLGSHSSASSPKNHHCYSIWSGPDFATSPSCSHFCGPREGQEIPSSERSKTDASLLKCEM